MLRGFYNAAQGMLNKQRALDAISNNVANTNTAGYKKDEVRTNTFMEELILVKGRTKTSGTFLQTYTDASKTDLEQSNFDFTGSKFDIGIIGDVYFNVATPTGRILQTRNGQFELDNQGFLTLDKARVQGNNGDIYLGNDDFVIDEGGYIISNEAVIDRLSLTYIPTEADVTKIGNSLFAYANANGLNDMPADGRFSIIQGAFEKSNVDANKEMTTAMETQRHYEANSTMLKCFDSINNKATEMALIG